MDVFRKGEPLSSDCIFSSVCLYPFQSREHRWPPDQQDHRIIHIANVSRRSLVPPPAERRVSDGIRSDYSQLCPAKSWKTGRWPHQLAWKTSSIAWLPLWEKRFSLKPVGKASLPALCICSHFIPLSGTSGYSEALAAFRFPQCCFFSRLNQPTSLSPCSQVRCFSPLGGSCWAAHRLSVPFPMGGWEGHDWTQNSRCDLPPINLMAEQLLRHLRMLLAFLAARAHSSAPKDFLLPRILSVLS